MTPPPKNAKINTRPKQKGNKMYKLTITKGKKEMLSFIDKNAVAAHALVKNANKSVKSGAKYSYTYAYIKA